ncbi:MAG: 4-hydroxythreonine-4-phosphate dehydrogenase PdxA [Bacteroidales bacterium]|nr:4-hydroxythreonine-4-phosphate dehydrogenase PdxA [Bacteroidales bacterium]
MENRKIRVGITHGDMNGIGYEIILKAFEDDAMFDLCTPIVYGSPKVATYYRKTIGVETNFSIINQAQQATDDKLYILNCCNDDAKVDIGQSTPEAGQNAMLALERVVSDYKNGLIDVLVTAPINKKNIQSDVFCFPGHTEYLEACLGNGDKALMILLNEHLRVALATGHIPVRDIASAITSDVLEEKTALFSNSLRNDFGIEKPRIAVLALNPHAGDDGLIGKEELETINPTISKMREQGILCFGPYAADGFFGSGNYTHFDGVLAMYHDQGLAAFKALSMDDGVNFTAGLPVVRTSPDHGTAYDIAGKGIASAQSLRSAIYTAIDIFRNREREKECSANPLRKLYYNKRDDSDKLKLDSIE